MNDLGTPRTNPLVLAYCRGNSSSGFFDAVIRAGSLPTGASVTDVQGSIEQTIRVQNTLDETQLRIEELQGQLRFLDDRTSLATIRLNLREEGVEPAEIERASIPNAFERSFAGFVGVIAGVVVGLGYLIPLVGIGLLAWFVVSRVRRRQTA